MASVQSTRKRRYETLAFGEEPTPHIESEGDRLIKDLSRKQLDTTLSLEKQKQAEKQFTRGSGFVVPLSVCQAGPSSAEDIVSKTVWAQRFNQLRHHGLTAEEAAAILNGDDVTSLNSKCEVNARLKRADEIRQIVERINTQEEADDSESISRHEKELALAVKPTSDQTRLFAFALSCQSSKFQGPLKDDRPLQGRLKDDRPLEHPINQLGQLHDQLFADVSNPRQAAKTVLRKRRQIIDSMKPAQQVPFEPVSEPHSKKINWDNQTVAEKNKPQPKPIREYTCKRETFYTIKDGKIVELKGKPKREEVKVEGEGKRMVIGGEPFVVPHREKGSEKKTEGEEKEEFERMSVEDIRNIPRFKDYERGQPSKVLYLKNLSRTIDEQDLVKLFSKYQTDKEAHIVYRLMTGRMSGQAFVTFSSIEQATLALDEVLGVVLKGKPIVMQFGRNT